VGVAAFGVHPAVLDAIAEVHLVHQDLELLVVHHALDQKDFHQSLDGELQSIDPARQVLDVHLVVGREHGVLPQLFVPLSLRRLELVESMIHPDGVGVDIRQRI